MLAKLVRPYSGSDYDKETVAKYLTVDEFYEVEAICMGGYSTDIKLYLVRMMAYIILLEENGQIKDEKHEGGKHVDGE